MRTGYLIKVFYSAFLAITFLILTLLTLRPAQAAPPLRSLFTNIVVTTTIQAAINAANPGDTVIVPAGTYTESLTLSKAVSLTGVSSATTIIHALPNQRVLTVTGATISNSVVISGLTLTGGFLPSNFSSCPSGCGAGMLITGTAQPSLQNLIIINNKSPWVGGGVYVDTASPLTLKNTIIISNSANFSGGGVHASGEMTINNTLFINNKADFGGGGLSSNASAFITQSRFENNIVTIGQGGGLLGGVLTIENTEFISNSAPLEGGGAILVGSNTLINSRFERNSSGFNGGGLAATDPLTITNVQFIQNRARKGGGIFYYVDGESKIINSFFTGNTVTDTGSAFYIDVSSNHFSPDNFKILHTTIADTILNPKTAIAIFSGTVGITNTIIASHTIGISQTAGTVYEDYNLFFGVPTTSTGTIAHGGHSLTGDPKFVAPASEDYHLSGNSAALNLAFPGLISSDFEGDPRPLGPGPDIGFDETGILFLPALTITKTVTPAGLLTPGQVLTYTIILRNSGNTVATGVQITDTLPSSITGTSLYTSITLPANQSITFTLPATLATTIPDDKIITNTAFYSHTSGSGHASITSTVQSSDQSEGIYLPLILKN